MEEGCSKPARHEGESSKMAKARLFNEMKRRSMALVHVCLL